MAELNNLISLAPQFNEKLYNAVDKSFWKLFSTDHSAFITERAKIEIPQFSGAIPSYDITSSTDWNAITLSQVAHTYKEYGFAQKGFGPVFVSSFDYENIPYDKASFVMDQMVKDAVQYVAEYITYNWTSVATNNVIPTTGTKTRTNKFGNTAIKRLTVKDISDANMKLDEQKGVPSDGRVCLLTARMFQDLKLDDDFNNSDMLKTNILSKGEVGSVDGVRLIIRETNNVFSSAGSALQAFGATPGATDLQYALVYHPDFVAQAVATQYGNGVGSAFFVGRKPGLQGQWVMEGYVRLGATIMYLGDGGTNDTGVVTIRESN